MAERRTIPIARPSLGDEEWQALREPIVSGWLTQGPQVEAFECAFAAAHGVAHAIATTSCTTALHLILTALGIGPGDEVIVPAFTWVSTANVVLHCGAEVVVVDICPETFTIDPDQVASKLGPRTRAIIPVHLFGLPADVQALAEAAPHVALVEDAACAAGASYRGRPAGSLGVAAAFSFHPRKTITTGEGGMVTTDNDRLATTIRRLRDHGASVSEEQRHSGPKPHLLPEFTVLGFNYRMTDLQGAVGRVQLAKLADLVAERRHWAEFYRRQLATVDWLRLPRAPEGRDHAWQAFVCMVDEERAPQPRNRIMERLAEQGISTRPGTHALHLLELYRTRYGFSPDDFPAALDCDRHSMAIPLHNQMSDEDYAYVVEALRELE